MKPSNRSASRDAGAETARRRTAVRAIVRVPNRSDRRVRSPDLDLV